MKPCFLTCKDFVHHAITVDLSSSVLNSSFRDSGFLCEHALKRVKRKSKQYCNCWNDQSKNHSTNHNQQSSYQSLGSAIVVNFKG